jgi:hypothetical protein
MLRSIRRDIFVLAETADSLLSSQINLLKAEVTIVAWSLKFVQQFKV